LPLRDAQGLLSRNWRFFFFFSNPRRVSPRAPISLVTNADRLPPSRCRAYGLSPLLYSTELDDQYTISSLIVGVGPALFLAFPDFVASNDSQASSHFPPRSGYSRSLVCSLAVLPLTRTPFGHYASQPAPSLDCFTHSRTYSSFRTPQSSRMHPDFPDRSVSSANVTVRPMATVWAPFLPRTYFSAPFCTHIPTFSAPRRSRPA